MEYKTATPLFLENRKPSDKQTFVCFGAARCGTSMVAGTMMGIGVNMGQNLPVNVEDPAFNVDGRRDQMDDVLAEMIKVIGHRQAEFARWGWKFPNASEYLPKLAKHIECPNFVVVQRDVVPAMTRAMSVAKPKLDKNKVALNRAEGILNTYKRNLRVVREFECPTLMVSYEKAVMNPELFVRELCDFCMMDPRAVDLEKIFEFVRPGSYKNPNDFFGRQTPKPAAPEIKAPAAETSDAEEKKS